MLSKLFLWGWRVALLLPVLGMAQSPVQIMKPLTAAEKHVIIDKGTQAPYQGEYTNNKQAGTYHCRQCGAELYRSQDKFDSRCGWPSFDDEIAGAVRRAPDADGQRTEILCANCGGHLGHVFQGEQLTAKNTRHCVNSISMVFVPAGEEIPAALKAVTPITFTAYESPSAPSTIPPGAVRPAERAEAIFAGGCFWGVEHLMQKQPGVISVESGYIGGTTPNPTYEQVCSHDTGHAEAVRVSYDPSKVSYETLTKLFLEIHDPTQIDRQGPDVGNQYRSEIFYTTPEQKATAEHLLNLLREKGYAIATQLNPATTFWKAETYHQDYYQRKGTQPYCHSYTKRF